MEMSPDFAGTPLQSLTVDVNWRQTMNYAAAVGDDNPAYFDDENPAGIQAPPMYCVALTWPITGRLGDYIEIAGFPKEVLATQVHYTEHIEIYRPVRPGDQLTIRGKIAAIMPHRAGTLAVIRFDAEDECRSPVFTEHIGGLMRGVQCTGKAAGHKTLPIDFDQTEEKPEITWRKQIRIDGLFPYIYDGCTDIVFPIHTSVKFARNVGLPGIIVQGTATLALAVREITNVFAGGRPASVCSIACRFTDMVLPATTISIEAGEKNHDKGRRIICFTVINHEGKTAVKNGCMILS